MFNHDFSQVPYYAAFVAGLLSFFSPCVLPLIPAYFTFITGFSIDDLSGESDLKTRKKIFLSTIAYVCGFSLVFILMGASASYLGGLIYKYKEIIRIIGGVLIILFGIHLTGIIRIRSLDFEKRFHITSSLNFFSTFMIGMAFGAGWSPCVGPLLGSILILASTQQSIGHGILLLGIYSAGLAIPFMIISIFINYLLQFIKKVSKAIKYINLTAGILLILVGLSFLFNKLTL